MPKTKPWETTLTPTEKQAAKAHPVHDTPYHICID